MPIKIIYFYPCILAAKSWVKPYGGPLFKEEAKAYTKKPQ